ncbi:MAG: hypothetical protein H6742_10275 [Alphaproteobacteria bacterium]|nr:hypothetical protein [Alphaproteobacteria bacterium]
MPIARQSADLRCPDCDREVPLADVSMDRGVALCRHCSRVFGLDELLGAPPDEGPPSELMAAVPPPAGVTVQERAGGLLVKRRWFHPQYLALLAFAVVWDSFLVFWYAQVLGAFAAGQGALLPLLFPVLHVAAGVAITWSSIAHLLNTTTVEVRGGRIRVHHGPVPWSHPPMVPTARLRQLFVVQKRGSKGAVSYEVHARLTDGTSEKLLSGLRELRQGRYIEKRIEAFLDIRDRVDPDEHVGD